MTNPMVAALEQAFQDVRHREIPLEARLAYIAEKISPLSTVYADAVQVFVERLERAGAGTDGSRASTSACCVSPR